MLAAILIISGASVLTSCSNSDNPSQTDTMVLTEWQAGRTVSQADVEAFGGIEKCFAAEPIPDGVWARMQGKTYKENPHIGRDDLRHIRALHWDYDDQMHVGEMIVNVQIADRVCTILRQLFDAKYPIQRMLLPDVYDATTRRASATATSPAAPTSPSTPAVWPSTSTRSTIPTIATSTTALASSSQPPPRRTVTAIGTSPTKSTTTTSASASSPPPASSGAATGPPARTSSILS